MLLLKSLPIGYTASLRDIKLINFTIDAEELVSGIPQLPLVKMNNHPVISLLDVKIHRLKPSGLFTPIHFTYRHIAFRVLINDNYLHNDGISRGFFYMYSFVHNIWVARCGSLFTNFNFKQARIKEDGHRLSLYYKENYLHYSLDPDISTEEYPALKQALMQIDRVYSMNVDKLKVTKIKRSRLPLESIHCSQLETNFFQRPKLLGAFSVKEILNYQWLPSQNCDIRSTLATPASIT